MILLRKLRRTIFTVLRMKRSCKAFGLEVTEKNVTCIVGGRKGLVNDLSGPAIEHSEVSKLRVPVSVPLQGAAEVDEVQRSTHSGLPPLTLLIRIALLNDGGKFQAAPRDFRSFFSERVYLMVVSTHLLNTRRVQLFRVNTAAGRREETWGMWGPGEEHGEQKVGGWEVDAWMEAPFDCSMCQKIEDDKLHGEVGGGWRYGKAGLRGRNILSVSLESTVSWWKRQNKFSWQPFPKLVFLVQFAIFY